MPKRFHTPEKATPEVAWFCIFFVTAGQSLMLFVLLECIKDIKKHSPLDTSHKINL